MYIKRLFNGVLEDWLSRNDRQPFVIRGMRQVGKTSLVRNFAKEKNLDLLEINLEKHFELEKVFAGKKITQIIPELEALTEKKIGPGSLLFLDEIQSAPSAFSCLRYFFEEKPEIPVIATGSFLDLILQDQKKYSVPVGRIEYGYLYPLNFEEFLLAKGEDYLLGIYNGKGEVPETAHKKFLMILKEYMILGGMPKVLANFLQHGDFSKAFKIQEDLLSSLEDDFGKYTNSHELNLLRSVFRRIPGLVSKKVKYSALEKGENSKKIKAFLDMLSRAFLIHKIHHTHANGIPLESEVDLDVYKILFSDIGLLSRSLGITFKDIGEVLSAELINKGPLAEQFVAQEIISRQASLPPKIYYWLREGKTNNAEVDFLLQQGQKILPIEVKSGPKGRLKSLHFFVALKKIERCLRLDLSPPSFQQVRAKIFNGEEVISVNYSLESFPLYLAGKVLDY